MWDISDYCREWYNDRIIHELVVNGTRDMQEGLGIQDLKCQACGKKFTTRRDTILYRLRTHSGLVEKIVWLLALGVGASTLEEVFVVREKTIRTWLCQCGLQGKKLHDRLLAELKIIQVQLDELWANIKNGSQDMWAW